MEVRCKKCNKMLYRVIPFVVSPTSESFQTEVTRAVGVEHLALLRGAIDCKCPRCGEMNVEKENVKDGKS